MWLWVVVVAILVLVVAGVDIVVAVARLPLHAPHCGNGGRLGSRVIVSVANRGRNLIANTMISAATTSLQCSVASSTPSTVPTLLARWIAVWVCAPAHARGSSVPTAPSPAPTTPHNHELWLEAGTNTRHTPRATHNSSPSWLRQR